MKPYFYFLFIGLLLSSCDDDDAVPVPETPLEELNRRAPATQTGAGNFGCLINGEVWLPNSGGPFDPKIQATYGADGDILNIYATDHNPQGGGYHILSLFYIGMAKLEEDFYPVYHGRTYLSRFNDYNNGEWLVDTTKHFSLQLTKIYYSPDYIVAGTFELTAYKPGSNDTLRMTHGRFDTHWTQY